jgi:HD-GYP domain-containing protein (c-di-GMP phosphodiesterase class II)
MFESKLSAIKEVASKITSTDNLDSITNLILDLALNFTKAKNGSILLLDEEGSLSVKASRGIEDELIPALRIKVGEQICGKVAEEKTPLLVRDIKNDERINKKNNGKYETDSFISCPILMKDKLLGVINIADKTDGNPFNEDELDLIDILANQTAISLEHAHLMSELRSKAFELDERNRVLIDSDRQKTEFITRMSHELRTPLNAITGAVYYLKEKKESKAEQKEFISIISDETNKLIHLLDGLLTFSSSENEDLILKKKVLNLKDIVQEAIASKIVKDALANHKVSIKVTYPESLPDIIGEKIRLIQSFIHLIDGITRYTDTGDSIELKAADTENSVETELFIKEKTIPESELSFIFNERSLWSGKDIVKNKLKFYLAKKTIELHNGTVSAFNSSKGFTILAAFPKSLKERRDAEINEVANLFLSFTAEKMDINRCSLMLSDELTGELTIRSALGIDEEIIRSTRLKTGDKIAGWVAIENKPLLIEDIEKDSRICKKSDEQYNSKSLLSLPITSLDKVVGVLNLANKTSSKPFDKKDLYLASVITERISHMIEKILKGNLQDYEFKNIKKSLETLLNSERGYQKKNEKVTDLVFMITQHLGCSEEETKLALYVSTLYDIGLTYIDESILMKTKKLSAMEQKIIKTHPFPGAKLIEYIETSEDVKKIILHHHERYDGSGYPDGLQRDEIPFISRVLAVVDAYSAMIIDRPYRKALTSKEAIEQIKAEAGKQFDPKIVDVFIQVI